MLSTPTISTLPELERSVGVDLNFHSALHGVIISMITAFGGYLQLQYQSQKKSPLQEHKDTMIAIYVNLFIYGMGLTVELKLKTYCGPRGLSIIKRITPLFGILVVVLIMIILYPVLGFVAVIIWALVTLKEVIKLFEEFLQWFWPIFNHFRNTVRSYSNRAENSTSGIQENGSVGMEANGYLREEELPI